MIKLSVAENLKDIRKINIRYDTDDERDFCFMIGNLVFRRYESLYPNSTLISNLEKYVNDFLKKVNFIA